MNTNLTLTQIEFTTKNGGVSPNVRTQVKAQALDHIGFDLSQFEDFGKGVYGLPVAIDFMTGKTIYLKFDISCGFKPEPKEKSKKPKTEQVEIPNLFND